MQKMEPDSTNQKQLVVTTPISSKECWEELSKISIPAGLDLARIRELDPHQVSVLAVRNKDGSVDKSECYKFIKVALIRTADFFGTTFTDQQLIDMSVLLYAKFWYWRLLDWKNFRDKVCGLEFGKLYGQMSPGQFMDWANYYDAGWTASAESASFSQHDSLVKRNDNILLNNKRNTDEKEIEFRKAYIEYIHKSSNTPTTERK
jgi:hypothetical protein